MISYLFFKGDMEILGEEGENLNINSFFSDNGHNEDGDSDKTNDVNSSDVDEKDVKKTIELLQSQGSSRLSYKAKIIEGKSRKTSSVWTKFRQVFLDDKPQCIWKCNNCPSLFIYNTPTGNSHMNRHKCNGKNTATSSEIASTGKQTITKFLAKEIPQHCIRQLNKDITIGLAKDLQPLYRSETEGFRYMAQKLIDFGARHGSHPAANVIQHRTTLKRTHLPQICVEIQGNMKESLTLAPSNPKFAFSKDMWTEKFKSTEFLSLSIHFIDQEWVLKKQLLGLEKFDQRKPKTTANIRIECEEKYFGNPKEVIDNSTSTTDGAHNMLTVFPNRQPCQCHKLNLFMEWTFNNKKLPTAEEIAGKMAKGKPIKPKKLFKLSDDCPQIDGSIKAIKDLVAHFKKTHLNAQLSHTLKQDVCTRWNSELIMLESYVESASEVQTLLLQTDSIKKLMFINENFVRELIEFLVPFRDCSQILSGDTYPTIQLVALWYHELREHIKIKDSDSAEMRRLKQQAVHCYEEYLVVNDLHYVACILDPR